jgi:hypothetical protein
MPNNQEKSRTEKAQPLGLRFFGEAGNQISEAGIVVFC